MKRFTFRGARILEWRRAQADAASEAFVRAAASARAATAATADAQACARRAEDEAVATLADPVGIDTIARYRIWIDRERRRVSECERAEREQQAIADARAVDLQRAQRHVKVMERLEQHALARYRELERQSDMKTVNELAVQQFASRRLEEGADRGR